MEKGSFTTSAQVGAVLLRSRRGGLTRAGELRRAASGGKGGTRRRRVLRGYDSRSLIWSAAAILRRSLGLVRRGSFPTTLIASIQHRSRPCAFGQSGTYRSFRGLLCPSLPIVSPSRNPGTPSGFLYGLSGTPSGSPFVPSVIPSSYLGSPSEAPSILLRGLSSLSTIWGIPR